MKDIVKKLDTSLECIQDLNATNVWMLDEFELAAMWERDRKEDDFSISEEKLLNVMRIAFEVVHYNKEDPRDVARYEDGKWATFTRGSEHKGNVAIRKKNIYSLSDLSYENVKHITAATLLELIDRNFGGGWDAISLAVKDIIESGFDISTTQLPASRMHIAGGTMERKVAQGYDVLEIARGTWIEAIFAKKKDPVAKLPRETSHNPVENEEGERMDDEDERSVADPNEGDEEDQNDDTFYSSYSPEAEVKQEDEEEGFISMEEE